MNAFSHVYNDIKLSNRFKQIQQLEELSQTVRAVIIKEDQLMFKMMMQSKQYPDDISFKRAQERHRNNLMKAREQLNAIQDKLALLKSELREVKLNFAKQDYTYINAMMTGI